LAAAPVRDAGERRDRLAREARAALQDGNLRAAGLAFEQALQDGDDPDLRRQYDHVRTRLSRYDDSRRKAADLRHQPATLEEAVAALRDAAAAWDTPQVRQEIDEYNLALARRRDRLAVAEFEVRGEVGLASVGKVLADELLPALKGRYDVVERGQFN